MRYIQVTSSEPLATFAKLSLSYKYVRDRKVLGCLGTYMDAAIVEEVDGEPVDNDRTPGGQLEVVSFTQ